MPTTYHIPGAGNPFDFKDIISRIRFDKVLGLSLGRNDNVIAYGCQQPGKNFCEAERGAAYLRERNGRLKVQTDATPKSTSETMGCIANRIFIDLENGQKHVIVMNWTYILRSIYLLWRQWRYLFPDTPWKEAWNSISFQPVSSGFWPRLKEKPLTTIPWWLWKVAIRECLAMGKAILDPYDKRLNQGRGSDKIFG